MNVRCECECENCEESKEGGLGGVSGKLTSRSLALLKAAMRVLT